MRFEEKIVWMAGFKSLVQAPLKTGAWFGGEMVESEQYL